MFCYKITLSLPKVYYNNRRQRSWGAFPARFLYYFTCYRSARTVFAH